MGGLFHRFLPAGSSCRCGHSARRFEVHQHSKTCPARLVGLWWADVVLMRECGRMSGESGWIGNVSSRGLECLGLGWSFTKSPFWLVYIL